MADDEGAVTEVSVEEAPRPVNHWEQSYRGIEPVRSVWLLQCDGCGSLVGDRARHDEWHRVTRSVVDSE